MATKAFVSSDVFSTNTAYQKVSNAEATPETQEAFDKFKAEVQQQNDTPEQAPDTGEVTQDVQQKSIMSKIADTSAHYAKLTASKLTSTVTKASSLSDLCNGNMVKKLTDWIAKQVDLSTALEFLEKWRNALNCGDADFLRALLDCYNAAGIVCDIPRVDRDVVRATSTGKVDVVCTLIGVKQSAGAPVNMVRTMGQLVTKVKDADVPGFSTAAAGVGFAANKFGGLVNTVVTPFSGGEPLTALSMDKLKANASQKMSAALVMGDATGIGVVDKANDKVRMAAVASGKFMWDKTKSVGSAIKDKVVGVPKLGSDGIPTYGTDGRELGIA